MIEKEVLPFCACGCGNRVTKKGNKWISGHNSKGKNNPSYKEKIVKRCEHCNHFFSVLPHRKEQRFCCIKCANKHKFKGKKLSENHKNKIRISNTKPKIIKICEFCGHTFEITPSQVDTARFCSRNCHDDYRKGKKKPNSKIDEWIKENTNKHLCKCGCGDYIIILRDHYNIGIPKYIHGHSSKGKNNPMYGSCRKGKDSPHWKGGTPDSPYCHKFNEPLKVVYRRYFNYLCFMDNELEENGNNLSVHHVGYDKRCGCNATQFCIFVPVKRKWNTIFNGNKEHNRWYWYTFLMIKIFIEHPNYFTYHIPVWGMNELEYNYDYVFEKFRRR